MVRQLQSVDAQSESEKKRKKLQKALRQIDDLKEKEQQGVKLEKTQQGKIAREEELRAELVAAGLMPKTPTRAVAASAAAAASASAFAISFCDGGGARCAPW